MTSSPPAPEMLAQAAASRQVDPDPSTLPAQFARDHEQRQTFRRLIDPGIFRPNPRQVAMDSLKTLSTIAENILREPDNPKYHTLKHENDTIKRRLIEPKGALEYALALGFRSKVVDFQSLYVFHPNHMADLRIGAAILKETLDRETDREERQLRSRKEQKVAEAAIARNVKLAFLDDRKTKLLRDQREREARQASYSVLPHSHPGPESNPVSMPGPGHTLAGVVHDDVDQPPPYHD